MRKLSPIRSQICPLLFPEIRVVHSRKKYFKPYVKFIVDRNLVLDYINPYDLPPSSFLYDLRISQEQKIIESIRYEYKILSI